MVNLLANNCLFTHRVTEQEVLYMASVQYINNKIHFASLSLIPTPTVWQQTTMQGACLTLWTNIQLKDT